MTCRLLEFGVTNSFIFTKRKSLVSIVMGNCQNGVLAQFKEQEIVLRQEALKYVLHFNQVT